MNDDLSKAKYAAHLALDGLWRRAKGGNRSQLRDKLYCRLSNHFKIPLDQCHIRLFDIKRCNEVIEWCEKQRGKK